MQPNANILNNLILTMPRWYHHVGHRPYINFSVKFSDFGLRSPDFLTKNWPIMVLPVFPTYSRLI